MLSRKGYGLYKQTVKGMNEDNPIKINRSSHFLSFVFVIFVFVYKL